MLNNTIGLIEAIKRNVSVTDCGVNECALDAQPDMGFSVFPAARPDPAIITASRCTSFKNRPLALSVQPSNHFADQTAHQCGHVEPMILCSVLHILKI